MNPMDDTEIERELLANYPLHIVMMVRAATKALEEGRARIDDGVLVIDPPAVGELDSQRWRKVDSSR
jgi:hypothetical protein